MESLTAELSLIHSWLSAVLLRVQQHVHHFLRRPAGDFWEDVKKAELGGTCPLEWGEMNKMVTAEFPKKCFCILTFLVYTGQASVENNNNTSLKAVFVESFRHRLLTFAQLGTAAGPVFQRGCPFLHKPSI